MANQQAPAIVIPWLMSLRPFPGDWFDHESTAYADFGQPWSKRSAGKRM